MNRLLALSLLALTLLAPSLTAAAAHDALAADITLSYANFPPAPTFPCVQMERWAKEVEKRTGGKVAVQTYPGSTLLGPKNMLRGVMGGQADIGCMSLAYHPGVFPLLSVFEMPLGFSSATVPSVALWDLYAERRPKEFAGVKVLTMFTSAPSNIMSKLPVRGLDDLSGLELRASGGLSKTLELLGATPVSMPMSETPEALQKGVVEGLLSSFDVLKDMNFAETCRYETVTNLPVYPFAVIMNLDRWNALPDDVKQVLDGLSREQAEWTGAYMDGHVDDSLNWSKEKYDIEVIDLSPSERDAMAARTEPMIAAWKQKAAAAGYDADAVLDEVRTMKRDFEAKYH